MGLRFRRRIGIILMSPSTNSLLSVVAPHGKSVDQTDQTLRLFGLPINATTRADMAMTIKVFNALAPFAEPQEAWLRRLGTVGLPGSGISYSAPIAPAGAMPGRLVALLVLVALLGWVLL